MVVGAQPCLGRVLVEPLALGGVAPVDVGGLARQAGPGHATLVKIDRQITAAPAKTVEHATSMRVHLQACLM